MLNVLRDLLPVACGVLASGCFGEALPPAALGPTEPPPAGCPAGTKLTEGQCVRHIVARKLECSGGSRRVGDRCVYDASGIAMSEPQQAEPTAEEPAAGPLQDPRPFVATPRALAPLVTEIQGMEQLLAHTPKTSAERPVLLLRTGNSYAELAACASKEMQDAQARKVAAAENKARAQRDAGRKHAVRLYSALLQDHPDFDRCDEVYYFLALELAGLGKQDAMREALKALVDKYPDSPLADSAREVLEP
jgi:hypothetical protein